MVLQARRWQEKIKLIRLTLLSDRAADSASSVVAGARVAGGAARGERLPRGGAQRRVEGGARGPRPVHGRRQRGQAAGGGHTGNGRGAHRRRRGAYHTQNTAPAPSPALRTIIVCY
eukprot:1184066-Prorocentrum_minimum.AAC.2